MWWRTLLAGGLLAGLLGACAVVDPVDSRYDTITRSLAKARNEAIFLNLVRASHDYPLSFTTIANVNPNMSNTSTFALPSFSLGPANCLPTAVLSANPITRTITCTYGTGFGGGAAALGSSTASNATAVSSNFNVSTQETGAFYDGFLKADRSGHPELFHSPKLFTRDAILAVRGLHSRFAPDLPQLATNTVHPPPMAVPDTILILSICASAIGS